jgi:hypothetical protein
MKSRSRLFDLADNLMMAWDHQQRTVTLGMVTSSKRWVRWDEDRLSRIEGLIADDLTHDGYRVSISRLSGRGLPCTEEARWKLVIRS